MSAKGTTAEEVSSRQHNRSTSSGQASAQSTQQQEMSNIPSPSSANRASSESASETPTTSNYSSSASSASTAVPKLTPTSPGSTAASSRSHISTSSPRIASTSGNAARNITPASLSRRDQNTNTAASHLSNQTHSTSTPPASLFGFLGGPRPANEDSHSYGWRANSGSNNANPVLHDNSNRGSSYLLQQSRPAITSFLGPSSGRSAGYNASGQSSRNIGNGGATVAALQQQHHQSSQSGSNLTGSPARTHAIVSGTSSPWMNVIHGQNNYHNNTMAASSGWTLADPAAWSGWSMSSGKACSTFEENQIVAFTWLIPEVNLLRDEVENSPLPSEGGRSVSAGAGKSEVWTTQPIFGDGKWKLELVRTSRGTEKSKQEEIISTGDAKDHSTTVLSVYITSMVLDYSPADMEIPATIMIGIEPVQSQSKASRSGSWIWREFANYIFRRENEYYECHNLPSLSELLDDADIQRHDAVSLTIQISTGPRAAVRPVEQGMSNPADINQISPFVVKDNHNLVHHSVMNGLERLLDCQSTGDVILISRERGILRQTSEEGGPLVEKVWPLPLGMVYEWAQLDPEKEGYTPLLIRDRLLYAHSSILCARSEFFRDMLQSNFAEGQEQHISSSEETSGEVHIGGRRVKTLRIGNADFTTVYWFLRYLYLEEVEFADAEDVRCAAALDDDWMTVSNEADAKKPLWQWTPITQLEMLNEGQTPPVFAPSTPTQQQSAPHSPYYANHSQSRSASMRFTSPPNTQSTHVPSTSSDHSRLGSLEHPRLQSPVSTYNNLPRRSNSDHSRRRSLDVTKAQSYMNTLDRHDLYQPIHLDPEVHPCEKNALASPLSLYKLAHRYNQQELMQLTMAHLINSLTPERAFQTLLATYLYTDLYEHVKVYVLDKWDQVSNTKEFEQCCDEVSAGEWGMEAGRALRVFMRSLTSPNNRAR